MPKVIPGYRDDARKKIIASGLEVMSKKGYCATTLDDIAAHVGVSKTTLYLYFSNKEDLVLEIVRSVHHDIHTTALHLFQTEPMLTAYEHLFEILVGVDLERFGFTHDVLALAARNSEIRKIYQEHMSDVIDNATQGIVCLQKRGIARTDIDPKTMALSLISLMNGLSMMVLKGMPKEEVRMRFHEIGMVILGIDETTESTGPCT